MIVIRLRYQPRPPPLYASAHQGPRQACYVACASLRLVSPRESTGTWSTSTPWTALSVQLLTPAQRRKAPSSAFCRQTWSLPDSSWTSPVDSPPIPGAHHGATPEMSGAGEESLCCEVDPRLLVSGWQSRQNPGPRDCVSVNGELVQTRVCTDYTETLYQRFRAEHPLEQVGRTTFFGQSSSLQTFGCLCQTHENAGHMLKALRSVVPSTISVSPDTFCGDYPDAESVLTLMEHADTTSEISFSEWQCVKCDNGKQWTKIVVCKLPADDFLQKVTRVVEDFHDHAGRVNTQYVELKKLKDSLTTTSLLLQMDFAENFSCSSGPRNVQSSYWNPQTATLHPIMVYYHETVGGSCCRKVSSTCRQCLHTTQPWWWWSSSPSYSRSSTP